MVSFNQISFGGLFKMHHPYPVQLRACTRYASPTSLASLFFYFVLFFSESDLGSADARLTFIFTRPALALYVIIYSNFFIAIMKYQTKQLITIMYVIIFVIVFEYNNLVLLLLSLLIKEKINDYNKIKIFYFYVHCTWVLLLKCYSIIYN